MRRSHIYQIQLPMGPILTRKDFCFVNSIEQQFTL